MNRRLISMMLSFRRTGLALACCFLAVGSGRAENASNVEIVATGLQFPEGTIFVGNTLYFVDYGASNVLRLVGGKTQLVWHQDGCGANGLVQVDNRLLVACYDSGTIAEISLDGRLIEATKSDIAGGSFTSPNDLTADHKGGIYFTASGSGTTPGKVYYRGSDKRVRELDSNIRYSNGLAVSPDGKRLYLAESEGDGILAYAIAPDGSLSDRKTIIRLADALASTKQPAITPDGVRIDRYGNLFVGLYRGGGVAVFSSEGKLLRTIDLPGEHHSNLAISPDGKLIFVTSVHDVPGSTPYGEIVRIANPIP